MCFSFAHSYFICLPRRTWRPSWRIMQTTRNQKETLTISKNKKLHLFQLKGEKSVIMCLLGYFPRQTVHLFFSHICVSDFLGLNEFDYRSHFRSYFSSQTPVDQPCTVNYSPQKKSLHKGLIKSVLTQAFWKVEQTTDKMDGLFSVYWQERATLLLANAGKGFSCRIWDL